MKVLVIPEDPTLDQYILKPIVERLFEDVGRKAQVDVLQDPHLGGVEQAFDSEVLKSIIEENPMVELFLLMVDRDCDRLRNRERAATREREYDGRLFTCLAVEEVEVWMMALHKESLEAPWGTVRSECDPKERYADPLLRQLGRPMAVGGGRKHAMRALGTQWKGLLQRCPELEELRDRVRNWLTERR